MEKLSAVSAALCDIPKEQRKLRGLEPINVKKSKGNSVVRRMKKALDKTESEFDGK